MKQAGEQADLDLGTSLRQWRLRRKLSQMELSGDVDISTRHLSFIETGRATPSRDTLQRLCGALSIALRERNRLFLKAGYAPPFPERALQDPSMDSVRAAMDRILAAMEPNPALVLDRHWTLISFNRGVLSLLQGVSGFLLQPPVNVLRLSFHPEGLAPRIVNRRRWQEHLLERLRAQISVSDDGKLKELLNELSPLLASTDDCSSTAEDEFPYVPLRLRVGSGVLSFLTTTMVFGSPLEVNLSELAVECFLPADARTMDVIGSR